MSKFSFSWLTTPALQALAQKIIEQSAQAFLAWSPPASLKARPAADQFAVWWRLKGPVNFTSHEDSRQYRKAVWTLISGDFERRVEKPAGDCGRSEDSGIPEL
jgi:hypothetical protein